MFKFNAIVLILAIILVGLIALLIYEWLRDNKSKVRTFFYDSLLLLTAAITLLVWASYWIWVTVEVWNG